jgi:membrane-associated phospholipid phosphatase
MDISILLALQNIRNGAGGIFAEFLLKMTFFGEMNTVLILMSVIYWSVSKEFGTWLLMGWSGIRVVNGFLKVTACVYRPWIRDPRVVPNKTALTEATGYSFPSGHSMNGAALYGGGAIRKEFNSILRAAFFIMTVLIAFSRNYLGVHTPQDVIVGVLAGMPVMLGTLKLMKWLEAHPKKDIQVMCFGILIAVIVAVFAAVKEYPVDYDAAGNLLVDGAKMAGDTFKGAGWCMGFLTGWVLERRIIGFSTDVTMITRVTRLMPGILLHYAISLILVPIIKHGIPGAGGILISCFLQTFYVSFVFPFCMKYLVVAREQNS